MAVAASFGLACALSVVVLGDESGYLASDNQKMKVRGDRGGMAHEEPPASFTVFGLPDVQARTTHAALRVPWLLGLIATRSIDTPVSGIVDLVARARVRIESGIEAHAGAAGAARHPTDTAAQARFAAHQADLGYGLLLPALRQ